VDISDNKAGISPTIGRALHGADNSKCLGDLYLGKLDRCLLHTRH